MIDVTHEILSLLGERGLNGDAALRVLSMARDFAAGRTLVSHRATFEGQTAFEVAALAARGEGRVSIEKAISRIHRAMAEVPLSVLLHVHYQVRASGSMA